MESVSFIISITLPFSRKESSNHTIASEAHEFECVIGERQLLPLQFRREQISGIKNFFAIGCSFLDALLDYVLTKGASLFLTPVKVCDLPPCEPYQGVAGTTGVIEKRKRMVFGQSGKPK